MNVYSSVPYFVCMALLFLLAATPLLRLADSPPAARRVKVKRITSIDGLRGFLALAVFFHHGAIYHEYLINGVWHLPPSAFYTLLGQSGVSLFFMITGYLFYSRMIDERGSPNWLNLYIARLFRIAPLYLFAILVMLLIVFARTGFHINVPPFQLAKELSKWLMLGLYNSDVNGYNATILLAGVTWTLKYEWWFYFSLLFTAVTTRDPRTHLPFTAVGFISSVAYLAYRYGVYDPRSLSACLFFAGMMCASLNQYKLAQRLPDWMMSSMLVLLTVVVFHTYSNLSVFMPVLLIGAVFFLITSGCTIFGLLESRPAKRLGDISYGVYLLQGLVLTLVFSIPAVTTFSLTSPLNYWAIVLLAGVALVITATVTHIAIENPGIKLVDCHGRMDRLMLARFASRNAAK